MMKWTEDQGREVRERIGRGETINAVAAAMGLTYTQISGYMKRNKIKGKAPNGYAPWKAEDEEYLRQNAGTIPVAQIARDLDMDASTVFKKLVRMGLKPPGRVAPVTIAPRKPKPVSSEVVPITARPWLTRVRGECKFPFGPRGEVLSCCAPTWRKTSYCEDHAAICGGYEKSVAA